jgi:hypothetical protein
VFVSFNAGNLLSGYHSQSSKADEALSRNMVYPSGGTRDPQVQQIFEILPDFAIMGATGCLKPGHTWLSTTAVGNKHTQLHATAVPVSDGGIFMFQGVDYIHSV